MSTLANDSSRDEESIRQECHRLLQHQHQSINPHPQERMSKPKATSQSSPPKAPDSFISHIFFIWLYPLLFRGRSKPFSADDLYDIHESDRSSVLGDEISKAWEDEKQNAEKRGREPGLLRTLVRIFGLRYAALWFSAFFEECVIKIGQPLCLGYLMRYFRGEFDSRDGWIFASAFVCSSVWYVIQHHPLFFQMQHNGMKMRIAASCLIYKKALKLSASSLEKSSEGTIVNLLSNDASRLDLYKDFMQYIWIAPCQLAIVVYILWTFYGWVALVGVAILLLLIPIQSGMGKYFGKFRSEISQRTDTRLGLTNQVLKAISAIKLFVWEKPFSEQIHQARKDEVSILKNTTFLRAVNSSIYYVTCKIVVFATLLTYVLTGGDLTAEKVFVTLALYNNVRMTLTLMLPFGVSQLAEFLVAIKRIQKFLLLPEKQEQVTLHSDHHPFIHVENFSAKWDADSPEHTLSNVSLNATSGDLVAVLGAVGAGKSSLLQSLLGDLPGTSGALSIHGTIAYVPQQPWIIWGTVRENILFGKPYDPTRYNKVTQVCALKSDFAQFPSGDNTFVGHKGATLSGGQKARICLARAVYADADVYLLDDPLSAVDARVGRHIYDQCITGYLSSKLVVLVTHQRQLVRNASKVLHLVAGRVEEYQFEHVDVDGVECVREEVGQVEEEVDEETSAVESKPTDDKKYVEAVETSDVGLDLYWKYVRSGSNGIGLFVLVVSNVIAQALYTGSDYWLKFWTTSTTTSSSSPDPLNTDVAIYGGIVFCLLVFSFLRSSSIFVVCLNASVNLHKRLVNSVMSTSMSFFDTHPSGRILNRFSKDIATMDDSLPLVFFDTIEVGLQVLGILIIVSFVNPLLMIPSTFVCLSFFFIRRLYLQTAQNLKRIEGISRSPVLSHVSSTIAGLSTIRAFKAEEKSIQEFCSLQDTHSSAWYLVLATSRWLGVTVDWVSVLYTAAVTVVLMLAHTGNANVGLALTSAMSLTGIMQWGVKQSSETANQIISVERVIEYSNLPPEESPDKPTSTPPHTWPSAGRIAFNNVTLKYDSKNTVLDNISLVVEPGHKVGVVGRTGAGKSSLISALLRIVNVEGTISIDSIDHSTLTLQKLRNSISVISQTPTLFNDSVRRNLDPLGLYTDSQIWSALDDVHLSAIFKSNASGLDGIVEEDGCNLSAGQRQLFCLARVILRKSRIIVLDEATANMDPETDRVVQETIKEKFSGCTLIVVAHRINTVIDADRILVLDGGRVKEYDSPDVLLGNEQSALSRLVRHANGEKDSSGATILDDAL